MLNNRRGFSLVELLVVVVITGVVATAILDLYVNVLRSTVSSEEVVEVQQGMRLALDQMAQDIQMAGCLVQSTTPITVARNDLLTMQKASAFNTIARIGGTTPGTIPASVTEVTIDIANAEMRQLLATDNYVRIVQPATGIPLGGITQAFQVTGYTSTPPQLKLTPVTAPTEVLTFQPGDVIVRVPTPSVDATYPNLVTYSLEDDPESADPAMQLLSRVWRTGLSLSDRVIANNISALRFEYLLNDGTVSPLPTAAAGTEVAAADLPKIVGVRIVLTGITDAAVTGGSKTRQLQTTVKIRNI